MERALVERARAGDEAAFARLVGEIGNRLHAVARHILGDDSAADDATQQALIEIWKHLPGLHDEDRFDAWAYRIVVREAYAEARRGRRGRPSILQLSDAGSGGDDGIGLLADRDRLERGFRHLSCEHRAVVVLKHYVGLGDDEIATVLNVPVGTVRSRLYYSMRALRAAIDADERATVEELT